MTKEEVLQRANDYCNERSYDAATLTDDFKEKFADFFAKRNPDGDINDESVIADLKFNLDTARSAALRGIASSQRVFNEKENSYRSQIKELNKKIGNINTVEPPTPTIPKELQDKLDRLEEFENDARKKDKFKDIVEIAKTSIRKDLHKSFEAYAKSYDVSLETDEKEQAKTLIANFQEIFKHSIGDIKPFAPKSNDQFESDILKSVKKVEI